MKNIYICTKNNGEYEELIVILKQELNSLVNIEFIDSKTKLNQNDNASLMICEVNSLDDFKTIQRGCPTIVVINGKNKSSLFVNEAYKTGAVDLIIKPFDSNVVMRKVKRFVLDITNKAEQDNVEDSLVLDINSLISREIKASTRGNYDYSLIVLELENTGLLSKTKKLISKCLRETDTALILNENKLVISLPFCDEKGSLIVKEKIIRLIKDNLKLYVLAGTSTYNDFEKNENLIELAINNLNRIKNDLAQPIIV